MHIKFLNTAKLSFYHPMYILDRSRRNTTSIQDFNYDVLGYVSVAKILHACMLGSNLMEFRGAIGH